VPSVQETIPASTMPLPTALEAWSPRRLPPECRLQPVASAAAALTTPLTSLDSAHDGRMPRSSPRPSIIS